MKFYHGTTIDKWKQIQFEGILFGEHKSYRYTYLTPDIEMAKKYGDVLLEVDYIPGSKKDNYGYNPSEGQECWQFSVFEPIELNRVRVIK